MLESILQSFSFIPHTASEELIFEYFFAYFAFGLPWETIKLRGYSKKSMFRRGLLKEYFCKSFVRIAAMFSHYKSRATISCHSNQFLSDWDKKKTILFVPPGYRCYMWNMVRIGFMSSEDISFENVDGRTDGRRRRHRRMPAYTYYKLTYEPSVQVS